MSRRATLLYDGDCGFCRWSVGQVLRRDNQGCLQTAVIQTPEGARLLASLAEDARLRSWHLALDDGRLYSGGAVFSPLLGLLGLRRQARLLARAPRLTDFAYRLVASRRTALGPLVSGAAKRHADELIRARAAPATVPVAAALPAGPGVVRTPGRPDPEAAGPGAPGAPGAREPPGPPEPPAPTAGRPRTPGAPPPAPVDTDAPSPAPAGDLPPGPSHDADGGSADALSREAGTGREARSWQQRFEESELGRGVLSTLIVVTLIAIVAINLPSSDLRRQLLRPGQPYLNALGVDQNWALFAPDPRRVVIDVSASVTFDDGSTAQWSFPHDGALIGTYRDYRWRKWEENLINPDNGRALWRAAALWAAGVEARPNHSTTAVALTERFASLAPPGVTPSVGPEQQHVFYVLRLRAGGAIQ